MEQAILSCKFMLTLPIHSVLRAPAGGQGSSTQGPLVYCGEQISLVLLCFWALSTALPNASLHSLSTVPFVRVPEPVTCMPHL